jgi:hypothetical protein
MNIGGIEAEIDARLVTYAEREPISLRVWETGGSELVWNGGRVKCESAADDPFLVCAVARPTLPNHVPCMLTLMDQSGTVRPLDAQIPGSAPVRPLNLSRQGKVCRNFMRCCQAHNVGRVKISAGRCILEPLVSRKRGRNP